jgi:endoglucanase
MKAVGFCVLLLSFATSCFAQNSPQKIRIDQVGYQPQASKLAFVLADADKFQVVSVASGGVVYEGKLGPAVLDADTADSVRTADFSQIKQTGDFYIVVPGVGKSWSFRIAPDVFSRPFYLVTRGFYGQRCGTAVDMGSEFPGFSHPACHKNGLFEASSGKQGPRPNIGGWHDAGDYGRYLPTSGIATGSLLWAYELFPDKTKNVRLNIPESGNGTPDILNEARWNLTWMLQMQDEDGGVWHKQTSTNFAGFVAPQDDQLPSAVIGTGSAPYKSTCATADLAAVAAIAARVYAPFDRAFAEKNLKAAQNAWKWTEQNPNVTFKNPKGVSTGEYGDSDCGDERLWAAGELWRTTGDATYHRYFAEHYKQYLPTLAHPAAEDWAQLAPMGLWSYVLGNRAGTNALVREEIRNEVVKSAKAVVAQTSSNGYRVSLSTKDYVWGSNGVAASYGRQLLVANAIAPDPAFVEAAADNVHYLLGRNTFGLSWITQLGGSPYKHPHHRPSGAKKDAEPWPGLLSGGPNAGRQDAVLKALPNLPPAKVYADNTDSYASNEIAINWQAAMAFLLAGVM